MKKLSLLLLTIFASVMAYSNADDPYTLNPYAYDLWSNWDPTTQKLTLRFKVNSVPNLESVEGWGVGIQVLAEDNNGGTYYIWGTPGDVIRAAHDGGAGTYEYTADLSSGVDLNGNLIPRNEDLTWKVRVAGRGNGSTTPYTPEGVQKTGGIDYTRVRYWASLTSIFQNNRFVPQSIAINTNPESRNFGRVIIADNNNHGTTWYSSWKNGTNRGRGVYAIEPDYLTISNGGKRASLDNSAELGGFTGDQKEPRGVCVSDDGRIFVSSYSNNSTAAVWEVTNTNNYASAANKSAYASNTLTLSSLTTVLEKSEINNYRVVSLDVKGTGNDMKLLLLCCSTTTNKVAACYEYNVSTGDLTSIPLHNDIKNYAYEDDGINIHAKIAYGKNKQDQKIDNVIWIGFSSSAKNEARLYAVDRSGNIKENEKFGDRLGGEGFFIKGDMLIKSYRNYKNTAGTTSTEDNPYSAGVLIKKIADDGYTIVMDDHYFDNDSYIWNAELGQGYSGSICAKVINDIAVDYANNVYLISIYTGRNFPISLPYSGRCETTAPSRYKFKLSKAVPNIMAMDLKREPNGNNPSYKFSFVTNAKPTHAEIRFYKKENSAKMFENIKTIHADNYDKGSHTISQPDYVYTFPSTALKQGEMSVILNMVGGERNVQRITNALPPGELYWTVYVEAEKNNAFAPIYHLGGINDGRNHRRHVAVNNYPETDMFGSLIVSDCPVDDVNGAAQGLWIYGFNPSGNCNDATTAVNDASRYSFRNKYLNGSTAKAPNRLNYPRRVAVAPDGKVYIADEGTSPVGDFAGATDIVVHARGGLKFWDPNNPNVFSLFADNQINTAFGVALWEHSSGLKVYSSNTYDEYLRHIITDANYTTTQQNGKYGWNGFVEYVVAKYTNSNHKWQKPDSIHHPLGMGDGSGNFSLVTMDQGVWMCQHREHTVAIKKKMDESPADNKEANLLFFVPYGSNTKTWMSCATSKGPSNGFTFTNGVLKDDDNGCSPWSQTETGYFQSTPGGGLAYRVLKDKSGNIIKVDTYPQEYLYVVNHDGNIVKIRISTWTDKGDTTATPGLTYITTLTTPGYIKAVNKATKEGFQDQDWKTSFISSMNFDYAGNLVITASQTRAGASHIIVYTMPYDRTNAQEIRASDDRILIPERLAQFDMTRDDINGIIEDHKEHQTGTCAIDLYRPMQGGMFNTFCVPFKLDINNIPQGHPLFGVEIKKFTDANIESIGGEKILTLVFGDVQNGIMEANEPHIIKPTNNIKGILELDWRVPLAKDTSLFRPKYIFDDNNSIIFQGILPKTQVDALYDETTKLPLRLILVADNRLAVLTGNGEMYGFRGYFDLAKPLPPGTVAKISARKDTPTNTTIVVDGKKVNIEKYLREGRVYIRVGDSLYTIDGQVVE